MALDFHKSIPKIALTLTASLAMRPVGALLFGLLADRYGRRLPLMLSILFYSIMEILSGLAPTYRIFLILRLLYGIGMGGEWGVGASLAMEVAPAQRARHSFRHFAGGLRARIPARRAGLLGGLPALGLAADVLLGGLPALLTLFIRAKVKESPAWKPGAAPNRLARVSPRHGRQRKALRLPRPADGHDEFHLARHAGPLPHVPRSSSCASAPRATSLVTAISMLGAIAGGILVGLLFRPLGPPPRHVRRRARCAPADSALGSRPEHRLDRRRAHS